ncbi:hypothetical protein [Aliiroseovarius sp. 2305UL8-7]|uniref:hypothetical protein n=1 Tax=Aliiroseovarius conchicola TaxID=3121637 RepID=UPI00352873DD
MRRSTEEVAEEFHRLYDILEAYVDAEAPALGATAGCKKEQMVSRIEYLEMVHKKTHTYSQLAKGVRSGLADCRRNLLDLQKHDPTTATLVVERYNGIAGRDLCDDLALSPGE